MTMDPDTVLATQPIKRPTEWKPEEVILYHLGLGAGAHPVDTEHLRYVFEADLKVLPTFGVITAQPVAREMLTAPGIVFDPMLMLHGEQELVVHRRLPALGAGTTSTGRIVGLYDKGKAAVLVTEVVLADGDGPLCTNRFSSFLRGAGGFGGDPGPATSKRTPTRAPDAVYELRTLPQQAALYRLSGDHNPLHIDPEFAERAGFQRPITHGLCTWGMACKLVVDEILGGDTTAVGSWSGRFSGVVYPGETLIVSTWQDADRIGVEVSSKERAEPVLSNGSLTIRH